MNKGGCNDTILITDHGQKGLCEAVGRYLSIPVYRYNRSVFKSTNELAVNTDCAFTGRTVIVLASLRPNLHEYIFEHFLLLAALKSNGATRLISALPFLPYSRSDKQFHQYGPTGVLVMLDLLKAAGADDIVTVDLHGKTALSHTSVHNVDTLPLVMDQIEKWRQPNSILIAQDGGARQRTATIAKQSGLPYICFSKQRTGDEDIQLQLTSPKPKPGFHAIIVDDAIYTASTLLEACKSLHALGASSIDVLVTHALVTREGPRRLRESNISRLVVSDSLPPAVQNIASTEVVSIAKIVSDSLEELLTGKTSELATRSITDTS